MSVRKFSPVTPGLRFKVANSFSELTKDNSPERSLTAPLKKSGGRNNTGKMTMRYKGGGHKRRYRVIDFARDKDNVSATVSSIEYDPNRTAFIALLQYADGEKRYIIAPDKLKVGDVLLWDKTSTWEWLPWSINGNGIIEWKNVPVSFHFAIYEGSGKFSDCTRLVTPPHPTLRLRTMTDLQKNPDFVLRLDLNQNKDE